MSLLERQQQQQPFFFFFFGSRGMCATDSSCRQKMMETFAFKECSSLLHFPPPPHHLRFLTYRPHVHLISHTNRIALFLFFSRAEWSGTSAAAATTQSVISFFIFVAQLGTRAGGCNRRQRSKCSVGLSRRRRQQLFVGLCSPLVPGRPTCRTSTGSATPDPR